jgi:shikimate dehydrogenase
MCHACDGNKGRMDKTSEELAAAQRREAEELAGTVGTVSLLRAFSKTAGKRIVILGAGDAARAIAVELSLAGAAQILIVNWTEENGSALAALIDEKTPAACSFKRWEKKFALSGGTDVLVNATPIGFFDDSKPPIEYGSIGKETVVCDVVPNKRTTPFLEEAKRAGARTTVDGLRMLVYLAGINFRMWTEKEPPLSVMREELQKVFGAS